MNDEEIISFVKPYTLLAKKCIQNILDSIDTIVKENIPGDFIEIGVFKGGAIMAMALKCKQLGVDRKIHAYDTFEGMTPSTINDEDIFNRFAYEIIHLDYVQCSHSFEATKANIATTEYDNIEYHIGDIRETDLTKIPDQIAMLRLDTDWYELTKFELLHFTGNVSNNGFIIIDDYGHWKGCKKAVDEYLVGKDITMSVVDYAVRFWRHVNTSKVK
jgi:hypothetical protein